MSVQNLSNLSSDELRKFFDSFDEILCDCDGVIWYLFTPIQGAAEAVQKLRKYGKTVRFATNNSIQTIENLYKTLEKANFGNLKDSLINPAMVLLDYLKENNFEKEVFALSNNALKEELRKNGFKVAPNGPESVDDNVSVFNSYLVDNPDVGAVVLDVDFHTNYIDLTLASLYLKRKDVKLIFLATDMFVPISPVLNLFGPKYFQEMLSFVSTQKPILFGKPSQGFADYIKKKCQIVDPKRILFIGDALVQDISFANENGFQSLLVLTGATKLEQLENWDKPDNQKPKYYVESLAVLGDLLDKI